MLLNTDLHGQVSNNQETPVFVCFMLSCKLNVKVQVQTDALNFKIHLIDPFFSLFF